jgi:predicted permease
MRPFRRRQFETEMDAELRFHIEARVEDLLRDGLPQGEAERRARAEFGGLEGTKEECRRSWGLNHLDDLRADLRLTFRMLGRNRGFAAVAIVSLALGIGANTAIFGLVDAVILRALPVRDPGSLVFLQAVGSEGANGGPPYPCFEWLRDRTTSFEGVAAFSRSTMELGIDGRREQASGVWVSGNLYSLLGVHPVIGRILSAADDQSVGVGGADGPVAVISRAYWEHRFGRDPAVVGRSIRVFDHTVVIVGVLPAEAMSPDPGRPIDIAVPMMLSDPVFLRDRGDWWLDVIARLRPGATTAQARAESDAIFQAYMADLQMSAAVRKIAFDRLELAPAAHGLDGIRKQFAIPLAMLTILAGLVLFAACVNVANLMLARSAAREREFAVRLAIGAGRGRLVRQTLTEGLVLVGASAALGIGLAAWGTSALAAAFAEGSRPIVLDLSLSGRMLLFTLVVSVLTELGFGVLPAFRAAHVAPVVGLGNGSRTVAGSRRALRVGRGLMILQVALSTVLLASSALFIRSLVGLQSVDLGFAHAGVLTMDVTPERSSFGKPEWTVMQQAILDRVRSIPGVTGASWSTMTPLNGRDRGSGVYVPGFVPHGPRDTEVHIVSVSPGFFETLGIPVLSGRAITSRDDGGAAKVAVLNRTAARFYFGDADPVGKRIAFERKNPVEYEIVGVVNDVKHESVRAGMARFVYLPIPQTIDRVNRLALAVRAPTSAGSLATLVQQEILRIGPSLLVANVQTLDRQIELTLLKERLVTMLSVAFGGLALLLACVGLYGTLAYTVARRTNELGIRMALGATRSQTMWLVLREGLTVAGIGIAIGVPAMLALGRLIRGLLYGVEPLDPLALGATAVLLVTFTILAGLVPARRAGALDPMGALRSE